jgi:hypothetical protein
MVRTERGQLDHDLKERGDLVYLGEDYDGSAGVCL